MGNSRVKCNECGRFMTRRQINEKTKMVCDNCGNSYQVLVDTSNTSKALITD